MPDWVSEDSRRLLLDSAKALRTAAAKPAADRLATFERQFLTDAGIRGRKWYRHVVQAPGYYLGYASEIFPGILQAIREHDAAAVLAEAKIVADRIRAAALHLQERVMVV